MALSKKKAYTKKKKPMLVDSDSLVSYTEDRQTVNIPNKIVTDILSKPIRSKISSCVKRSKLNTEASDRSTMGKSLLPKPNSTKVLPKAKIEVRQPSKVSKPKEQPIMQGISNKFFNTCALQQRNIKVKISPRSSKNIVNLQKPPKEQEKAYFSFKCLKPESSMDNIQKLNLAKSNKFFAKLKAEDASIKNKFVINIKNFQSPQKPTNLLVDFMNTNIYGKTKLNISSSPQRPELQNPSQPSLYKISVPHNHKSPSPRHKETSIDTKVFREQDF